jgi:hypothetical protein
MQLIDPLEGLVDGRRVEAVNPRSALIIWGRPPRGNVQGYIGGLEHWVYLMPEGTVRSGTAEAGMVSTSSGSNRLHSITVREILNHQHLVRYPAR